MSFKKWQRKTNNNPAEENFMAEFGSQRPQTEIKFNIGHESSARAPNEEMIQFCKIYVHCEWLFVHSYCSWLFRKSIRRNHMIIWRHSRPLEFERTIEEKKIVQTVEDTRATLCIVCNRWAAIYLFSFVLFFSVQLFLWPILSAHSKQWACVCVYSEIVVSAPAWKIII